MSISIVIGTTRPFHLVHIARELSLLGNSVRCVGYVPKWRFASYGLGSAHYASAFSRLLPTSFQALQRWNVGLQHKATEKMLQRMDEFIARAMPPCDFYIGLSSMAIKSSLAARRRGATVICERGSSHVLHQQALLAGTAGALSEYYVDRELQSYEVADYIAVPSTFALDSFLTRGISRDRLFLNNYGVDLERFPARDSLSTEDGQIKLVFVGSWCVRKGCDLLIELLKSDDRFTLTHVGAQVDLDFPTSPRFLSLGHVNNEALYKVYKESNILVLPSREDGYGMVILEALASGLRCVTSLHSGGPDAKLMLGTEGHAVQLMNSVSVAALKECIHQLLGASTMGPSVAIDGISRAARARLSWSAYGARYAEFLKTRQN